MAEKSSSQVDPRIPADRRAWIMNYRVGLVENVFGDFECDVEDCECQFMNLFDFLLHSFSNKHGALGDQNAEEKRMLNKYYSRQGRMKERLYRKEAQEESQKTQQTSL